MSDKITYRGYTIEFDGTRHWVIFNEHHGIVDARSTAEAAQDRVDEIKREQRNAKIETGH